MLKNYECYVWVGKWMKIIEIKNFLYSKLEYIAVPMDIYKKILISSVSQKLRLEGVGEKIFYNLTAVAQKQLQYK